MYLTARTNDYGLWSYMENYTFTYEYVDFQNPGNNIVGSGNRDSLIHRCYRESGGKSPQFKVQGSSTSWRKSTNYWRSVWSITKSSGTWIQTTPFWSLTQDQVILAQDDKWQTNPIAFDDGMVIWSDELESESIAKALQKIKDHKVALGEDLAEARKTFQAVAENGATLLKAALALKRGNIGGVWSALKDNRSVSRRGADLFLQYKYGWKPLMSDIYNGVELLREQLKPAFILSTKQNSHRESVHPNNDSDYQRSPTGPNYRQCRCVLHGVIDSSVNHAMDQLSMANPLSLAWELVPWSFVVDWFVPVGNTLDGLTHPAGVNFLSGCTTMGGELNYDQHWIPPVGVVEVSPRTNSYKGASHRRKAYYDWPIPGLYAVNPFSYSHGQSAFALLLQRLRG